MPEGPSTTTTPSNQFVMIEMHCVRPSYVQAHMESLRWRHFARRTANTTSMLWLYILNNCLTVVGHIPREITRTCYFFIKNKGEITGEVAEDDSTAQQLVEV